MILYLYISLSSSQDTKTQLAYPWGQRLFSSTLIEKGDPIKILVLRLRRRLIPREGVAWGRSTKVQLKSQN